MAKLKLPKKDIRKIAFIAGLLIAVIAGLIGAAITLGVYAGYVSLILVALGIVVGFISIAPREKVTFLIAAIALSMLAVVSFEASVLGAVGTYITSILSYIVTFIAPAAVVVALTYVYELALK